MLGNTRLKSESLSEKQSWSDQLYISLCDSIISHVTCDSIISQGKLEEWKNWHLHHHILPQTETITTDKFWSKIFSGGNFFGAFSPVLQLLSIGCQWTSNSSQSYSQMANNKSSLDHDENNDRESQVCCLFLSSNYVACKTKKAHENLRKCHVTGQIPSFLICPDHKPEVISDWAEESPLSNHKWDVEQPQTGLGGFGGKWFLPSLLQMLTQSQATEIWIGQKS